MMDKKEELKNNIMLKMRYHLDSQEMDLLGVVLTDELTKVEVEVPETELATVDNTNEYIMDLFMLKKAPKLSDKTVRQYTDAVRRLTDYCQKPLTRITSMDVEGWLNSITGCNSNTSLNNQRRHLSAFFTWLRKSKIVSENPVESIEPYPEQEKPVDHMEAQEYEELKSGCTCKRDRAMMELLRSTAIRVGEAEQLNVNNIDWRTGSVLVYGQKTRTYRTVYLDDIALKYLGEYIQERRCSINSREPLFVSERAVKGEYKRLSRSGIRSAVRTIAQRAEVERRVYPHLFRKTTATNICKRGGTVWDAGHYLGHKDRSTAGQHYVAEDQECMRSIFRLRVATV